jgi:DNA-binding SARP family transcriptional activator
VPLPQSAERVVAFLAVHDRAVERSQVAGTLWPDATDSHAAGSLRSALWRLHDADGCVVEATTSRLRLAPLLRVDLREGLGLARRLLQAGTPGNAGQPPMQAVAELDRDLLPDWYLDDWLVLPREQWRQMRLHALEVLAMGLAARGEFAVAVAAALAAVRGEPLRESAHRCLIQVHLAEGNAAEAVAEFQSFRRLLHSELGMEPSSAFIRLLRGATTQRGSSPPRVMRL